MRELQEQKQGTEGGTLPRVQVEGGGGWEWGVGSGVKLVKLRASEMDMVGLTDLPAPGARHGGGNMTVRVCALSGGGR